MYFMSISEIQIMIMNKKVHFKILIKHTYIKINRFNGLQSVSLGQ